MTVRIPFELHEWLKREAQRLSHQRGYRYSMNRIIITVLRDARYSPPVDRPWKS